MQSSVLHMSYCVLFSHCTQVQERALKCVPDLCESIDYAEVQGVLFPRVAVSEHVHLFSQRTDPIRLACVHENAYTIRQSGYIAHFLEHGEDLGSIKSDPEARPSAC